MSRQLTTSHNFAKLQRNSVPRSQFDLSHGHKTTLDAGWLYPLLCMEALPGDTISVRTTALARLATPIKPLMDNIFIDWHYFAVPKRLLWTAWVNMMGERENPDDSIDFEVPVLQGGIASDPDGDPAGFAITSPALLMNIFGIPAGVDGANVKINSLPFRGYNLIWNEWYRAQDIQNSINVPKGDGPDIPQQFNMQPRNKRHDYFTSCMPYPQKGDMPTIPIFPDMPLETVGDGIPEFSITGHTGTFKLQGLTTEPLDARLDSATTVNGSLQWADPKLQVNLSDASTITINQLRESFQIQRMLERDMRGGTRYQELLLSHFGVLSPDARMQRPEYLGGGSSYVNFHTVPQTQASDPEGSEQSPQGNLAAFATSSVNNQGFTKSFTEHCYVYAICSIRADLNYQQGLHRMWSRSTRYDFYWPSLSHLGEQEVYSKELWCSSTTEPERNDEIFGYNERYSEYRYMPSKITGKMQSASTASLDIWHVAQDFTQRPVLNDSFIRENPPIDRVIATPDEPQFIMDAWFNIKAARPMPMYGTPGYIDHF